MWKDFIDISRTTRHRGFSDRLYWLNFRMVWIFVICCFVLNVISGFLGVPELAIVTTGIPCAFTELGLHTGFIVWKAKVENCRKHKEETSWIQ